MKYKCAKHYFNKEENMEKDKVTYLEVSEYTLLISYIENTGLMGGINNQSSSMLLENIRKPSSFLFLGI